MHRAALSLSLSPHGIQARMHACTHFTCRRPSTEEESSRRRENNVSVFLATRALQLVLSSGNLALLSFFSFLSLYAQSFALLFRLPTRLVPSQFLGGEDLFIYETLFRESTTCSSDERAREGETIPQLTHCQNTMYVILLKRNKSLRKEFYTSFVYIYKSQ